MRRLTEPNHSHLARLPVDERLFVQRWIEMFDEKTPIFWRARGVARQTVENEAAEVAAIAARTTKLRRPDEVVLAEHASLPTDKRIVGPWSASSAGTYGSQMAYRGIQQTTLFQAYSRMVDPTQGIETSLTWLDGLTKHTITMFCPVVKKGRRPAEFGLVKFADLDEVVRDRFDEAVRHKHLGEPCELVLKAEVDSTDPGAAFASVQHSLLRHALTLPPRSGYRPIQIGEGWCAASDPADARAIIGFRPRTNFEFLDLDHHALNNRFLPRTLFAAVGTLSSVDPTIIPIFEAYRRALDATEGGETNLALVWVCQALDLLFHEDKGVGSAGTFNSIIRRGPALLALDYLPTHLRYVIDRVTTPAGRRQSAFLRSPNLRALLSCISDDDEWSQGKNRGDGHWNSLLNQHRDRLLDELDDAAAVAEVMSRLIEQFEWDLARLVRRRHAAAHHGSNTVDPWSVAMAVEVVRQALLLRLKIADDGVDAKETWDRAASDAVLIARGHEPSVPRREIALNGWGGVYRFLDLA